MPADEHPRPPETCPGCGAVLVPLPDGGPSHRNLEHPGASASCARLFEVTVHGLREDAMTFPAASADVALADAAYDAQHPVPDDPDRTSAAVARLAEALGVASVPTGGPRPRNWRTTIADVAADLDVVDLPVLVQTWARGVHQDWCDAAARV